ncbi:MAG TPA: hypothetical protein VHJ77_06240 [Vicinamibacterales bacterium]|jgi:hypothetical protein|nr:hypothetical protein [Vicinamibacterales bacterium]
MRDLVAGLVAVVLLLFALLVAATLHFHRRRRERARGAATTLGRKLIAELPLGVDLVYFAEDDDRFYHGDQQIEKGAIRGVRLLVNDRVVSHIGDVGTAPPAPATATADEQAFIRDRWDVVIDTASASMTISCGAIRERISQDLARRIYDAVAASLGSARPI